jgi:hypothetical protein
MSQEDYDLKPSKQAYQAVKADVTPVSAYKELVDNAFDNWRRVLDGLDPLSIEIEYHEGEEEGDDEVVIRDHSGGVEEDDLKILFALGQSKKDNISGSIGAYGVGAKKAIVNLGNKATIRSRYLYADSGFGFTIDEDWLNDDDDWTVDKEEYHDIEEGVTEIRISDLNTPWGKYKDDLVEDLSKTYQRFLRHDGIDDLETVSMVVKEFDSDGQEVSVEELDAPEKVDWSFAPIDGLYPRRYEGIELRSQAFEQEVSLNITVGLMREGTAEDSGADIYCQNRQVLEGIKDERAAFKTGSGSNRLGAFNAQHRRLKVVIGFQTDGDAEVLPWDAQKSNIDRYNRVSRAAYNWVRRIVRPYHYAAGDFSALPTTLIRPYGRDNDFAVTEGLDAPYDYSGRERVTDKPGGDSDNDFPEAEMIGEWADVTAALGVYSLGSLDEKFEPAYRAEFVRLRREEYDVDVELDARKVEIPSDTVPTADVPSDLTLEEAEDLRNGLQGKATSHAESTPPKRLIGLEDWKQEVYDLYLRQAIHDRVEKKADSDPEDVDIGLGLNWGDASVTVDLGQLETVEHTQETDSPEMEGTDDDGGPDISERPDDEDDADPSSDTVGGDEEDAEDETSPSKQEDDNSTGGETSHDGTDTDEPNDGDEEIDIENQPPSQPDDDPSPTNEFGAEPQYGIELDEDEWETLVDALGLDADADPDDVREQLLQTVTALQQLPSN